MRVDAAACRLIATLFAAKFQHRRIEENIVKSILLAAVIASFTISTAFAQETCESKAVGKDGKALGGAAKTSFLKKCKADSCATKAMSADGKPLAGAAKNSFMTKCEKNA
jgi:hypothetical protein